MAVVPIILTPRNMFVGATAIPELALILGSNAPILAYCFDAAAREDIYDMFRLPLYGSGDLTLKLGWYSRAGEVTGDVVLGARVAAVTPGDATSMEAKNWAAAATTTTTVNATAKGLTNTDIAISNLDGLAADDELWLNIYRDAAAGGDTLVGDVVLNDAMLSYVGSDVTGKYWQAVIMAAAEATSGTGQTAINGLNMTFPGAGTYAFEYTLLHSNSSTSGDVSAAVTAAGGSITNFALSAEVHGTATTVAVPAVVNTNGTATAAVARTVTTQMPTVIRGSFTATAAGTLAITHAISANTLTANIGSYGRIMQS